MTETQEALEAMAKAEAAWEAMIDETVQVSGQFIKECEEATLAMTTPWKHDSVTAPARPPMWEAGFLLSASKKEIVF